MSKDIMFVKIYGSQLWTWNWKPKWSLIMWWINMLFVLKKSTCIVWHLPLGKNGKFAKMIFYFLRADQDAEWKSCHKKSILATGTECKFLASWRSQTQEKWWKFLLKIFNVVQKRANKKLLLKNLFFHLLNQQSDALNSLIPSFFANSKAFSFSMIPSIGTFWLLYPTNHWKTALSIWS